MTLSYDAIVIGLETAGVPHEKAIATARVQCGLPPAPDPALSPRDATILEKTEQGEVRKRFVPCGFKVYSLSQARAAKQTPGLGDLWIVHTVLPIALWWETKRQVGGEYSTDQRDFAAECARCGVGYGTGDRFDAEVYLIGIGRAAVVHGVFEPIPWDGHPF